MKSKVEQAVALIRLNRTKRRRTAALLLALSCFVSANVFWSLRDIGTALTGGALCGMEEHVHSAQCYEALPAADADGQTDICTDADGNRIPRLICGKEAHIHGAECVPSLTADVESAADWEATLPDTDAGSLREQLARTAESQLGYSESTRNYSVSGGERHNYSRYGQWYGSPYGNWNPLFVYFCMFYAGVPEDRIPGRGGCWAWTVRLDKDGLIRTAENGTPVRGDILLLDQNLDGKTDRIGIVTLTQTAGEELVITAAEGACDGTAAEMCYLWNDPQIAGFVSPEDPETLPALEYSVASESMITVHASADADVFPAGTVMSVTDIAPEDAVQIAEAAADGNVQIRSAAAVDISFRDADGNELEPAEGKQVSVCMTLPENLRPNSDSLRMLHQKDDGTVEEIPDAVFAEDSVSFEADAFSIYVISNGSQQLAVDDQDLVVGEGNNSADNPYVMRVGDTVRLTGYSNVQDHDAYLYPNDPDIVAKAGDPNQWDANYRDGTLFKTEHNFEAKSVGNTSITLEQLDASGSIVYERFYIKVVYRDSILVKTSFEPEGKGYNHIKEHLEYKDSVGYIHNNQYYDRYFDITMLNNVDGYMPNSWNGNFPFGEPYTMYVGQEVELFPLILSASDPNNPPYLIVADNDDSKFASITPQGDEPGVIRLRALKTGQIRVINSQTGDTMYINVRGEDQKLRHADMEIADGGKYTIASVSYDANGNKTTTVKVYNAYVSSVNRSEVYDKDDKVLMDFTSSPRTWVTDDGQTYAAPNGEYLQIGSIGSGQYEYTSAFNGEIFGSLKEWNAIESDHAMFDVQLTLVPNYQYTISGDTVSDPDYSIAPSDPNDHSGWLEINNAIFNLDKQDVTDALNKCPFTNGLDFTVRAKAAILQIRAQKNVTGVPLQADEYSFKVTDTATGQTVSTVSNDADGNILFDNLRFEETGTYIYELSEIIPEENDRTENMHYDETKYRMTISVTDSYDADGNAITLAEITQIERKLPDSDIYEAFDENPEFNNDIVYVLPATGGTGVLPYLFAGTGFIALSILLIYRRRKEVFERR